MRTARPKEIPLRGGKVLPFLHSLATTFNPHFGRDLNWDQGHGFLTQCTSNRRVKLMMSSQLDRAAKLPPKITDTHVFFFGWEGTEPAVMLQQWHIAPFADESDTLVNPDGSRFATTEHYMMYHKALLMSDFGTARKIIVAATPAEAKRLGREVKNFDSKLWDEKCDDVVERGNWLKFSQNDDCRSTLIGTGERMLVEASPADRIWGIGFAADEAEGREAEWGQNRLGKALERVRKRLQDEQAGPFLQLSH